MIFHTLPLIIHSISIGHNHYNALSKKVNYFPINFRVLLHRNDLFYDFRKFHKMRSLYENRISSLQKWQQVF